MKTLYSEHANASVTLIKTDMNHVNVAAHVRFLFYSVHVTHRMEADYLFFGR